MSINKVLIEELARRRESVKQLKQSLPDINAAIEQLNDLDESLRGKQMSIAGRLECIYKEKRQYDGDWPIVYTLAQTDKFPFFSDTDDKCNPYFPISLVQSGQEDGLAPIFSDTNRSGGSTINRQRSFTNEELTLRADALTALENYPDTFTENEANSACSCSDPTYDNQTDCEDNGGTWECTYNEGVTAPEILEAALLDWRPKVVEVQGDVCVDEDGSSIVTLLQGVIDNIDLVIAELPDPPIYPDNTPPASGVLETAINDLISKINNDMANGLGDRLNALDELSGTLEDQFFGVIKLRLHQVNGSFSKVKNLKNQRKTNLSVIQDHEESIASINKLRTDS